MACGVWTRMLTAIMDFFMNGVCRRSPNCYLRCGVEGRFCIEAERRAVFLPGESAETLAATGGEICGDCGML